MFLIGRHKLWYGSNRSFSCLMTEQVSSRCSPFFGVFMREEKKLYRFLSQEVCNLISLPASLRCCTACICC
jgi:hypothetical protein